MQTLTSTLSCLFQQGGESDGFFHPEGQPQRLPQPPEARQQPTRKVTLTKGALQQPQHPAAGAHMHAAGPPGIKSIQGIHPAKKVRPSPIPGSALGRGAGTPPSLGLKGDVLTGALPSLGFTVRFWELTWRPGCGCLLQLGVHGGRGSAWPLPSQLLLQRPLRCFFSIPRSQMGSLWGEVSCLRRCPWPRLFLHRGMPCPSSVCEMRAAAIFPGEEYAPRPVMSRGAPLPAASSEGRLHSPPKPRALPHSRTRARTQTALEFSWKQLDPASPSSAGLAADTEEEC